MILYTNYTGSCKNDFNVYVYCKGVVRSLHPTHSVAACGAQASELVHHHHKDRSPVGSHSPFRKVDSRRWCCCIIKPRRSALIYMEILYG